MGSRSRIIALLIGFLLSAPGSPPLEGKEIRIAVGEQPPLFSRSGGIVDRVVALALRAAGHEAVFDWLPIGRMLAELGSDKLSVYVTPSNTPGQQHPHVDILEAKGVFFYKKGRFSSSPVSCMEDLAKKRVATVINSPLRPMLESAGATVDEGPFETMFAKLDLGRVDLTATADVGGIVTLMRDFPGREGDFSYTDFSYSAISAGLYAVDGPENRDLLRDFRTGFERIKADGSLEKLLREFFGDEHWRRVKVL